MLGQIVHAAYGTAEVSAPQEQELQAQLAELLPSGWFYDRVAGRLAKAAGNEPLLNTVQASAERRASAMVRRSRLFAVVEATLMVSDQEVGRYMTQVFMEDLRHAEEITAEAFGRRSWLQRLAERTANLFTRLL